MKRHELKLIQPYFDEVVKQNKTFEIRNNDRNFSEGDLVIMKEYDVDKQEYTGLYIWGWIGFVLDNEEYLQEGYVAFSFHKATNGFPPKKVL